MAHPPPPRRSTPAAPTPPPEDPSSGGWKSKMKARGAAWGKVAMEKGIKISDNLGGKVNTIAADKFGTEAFWPVTGDLPNEMEKCARILRSFTETGVIAEAPADDTEKTEPVVGDKAAKKKERKVKVIRKIPPKVIQEARGLVIFTAFRSGIAPLGGAGGAGVVIARLEDGSWSAPSSVSPNNLSTGFLIGLDVYDAILILRTDAAVASFASHKVTIGAELGVAAGPYGAGASIESGKEGAPIFSYIKSRGMYAGIEIVGQVFVERYDENGSFYAWTGVKAGDILSGKVKKPREANGLYAALADAESGRSQATPTSITDDGQITGADEVPLHDGEVLHLPPTPEQMDGSEGQETEERKSSYPAMSGANSGTASPRIPPPIPARRPPAPEQAAYVDEEGKLDAVPAVRPSVQQNDSETSHYSTDTPPVTYDPPTGPPPVAYTAPTTEATTTAVDHPAANAKPPAYAQEYIRAADGTDTTVHDLQKGMEKTTL